ncbi:MAG: CocE/NonD family hydrolase C-terminal non-catalytic domain-containing protein, partial [Pseudomonadota bacterium]
SDYDGEHPLLDHNPPYFHGRYSRSEVRWGGRMMALSNDDGIDERGDELGVLTFTTEALPEDREIAGPLLLTFWARTAFDRPLKQEAVHDMLALIKKNFHIDENLLLALMDRQDVQWVVELNDVFPDGRAKNITSGWLSAWHRPYDPAEAPDEKNHRIDPAYIPFDPFYNMPHKNPQPITQGELYPYAIELLPCDTVFKKGHRMRISISASDFPHLLPVLRPSRTEIVIDEQHPAQLEFKEVNSDGEGVGWKWIDDINTYF